MGSKTLDRIYLDTTFASHSAVHRSFEPKARGIGHLLSRLESYPEDTVFHLHAWTFGYEGVWIALANALRSQVCPS